VNHWLLAISKISKINQGKKKRMLTFAYACPV
jgi:hypothetical protein